MQLVQLELQGGHLNAREETRSETGVGGRVDAGE